jgi:hypothetical protein
VKNRRIEENKRKEKTRAAWAAISLVVTRHSSHILTQTEEKRGDEKGDKIKDLRERGEKRKRKGRESMKVVTIWGVTAISCAKRREKRKEAVRARTAKKSKDKQRKAKRDLLYLLFMGGSLHFPFYGSLSSLPLPLSLPLLSPFPSLAPSLTLLLSLALLPLSLFSSPSLAFLPPSPHLISYF